MLILAGIFYLILVFILRRKCLIVLVTFNSFVSFIVLVDEKSLHFSQLLVITFSQTAVTNIYFVSYFICSLKK